jgi:hypothetical protein
MAKEREASEDREQIGQNVDEDVMGSADDEFEDEEDELEDEEDADSMDES